MDKMLLAAGLACLFAAPVFGQTPSSAYTRTDEGACTVLEEDEEGGGYYFYRVCEGYGGWAFHNDGGEHGQSATYLPTAEPLPVEGRWQAMSSPQTRGNFGYFNNVIEWRISGERGPDYAVIQRYIAQTPPADGQGPWTRVDTLTVSALRGAEAGGSCIVAHIDASRLNGANLVARDVADRFAPGFTCGQDSAVLIDSDYPSLDAAIAGERFAY